MPHKKGDPMDMQQTSRTQSPQIAATSETAEMALIMRLSGEAFGLPVPMVNEIIDPIQITRVPNASAFAPGLINVRGAVVPLLDLRHRLRMAPAAPGATARIVVVETTIKDTPTRLAFLADAVEEVIDVELGKLEPVPKLGAPWPDTYVLGVLRHTKGLVVLLNASTLFQPEPSPTANA
jgi:purine-binding chemotaxis protein CheW